MVNNTGAPGQPLIVGVTSISPLIVAVAVLVAVNEFILSIPFAGNPMAVLLFVQL